MNHIVFCECFFFFFFGTWRQTGSPFEATDLGQLVMDW